MISFSNIVTSSRKYCYSINIEPINSHFIRWCHNSGTTFFSIRSKSVIDYGHQRIINGNPFSLNTTFFSHLHSKWQYVSPVKFSSWAFNIFRSANRQWTHIRFTTSCFILNNSCRYFASYGCNKQYRGKSVSLCTSFHCFILCIDRFPDCL